jgi:DNA-directed RNA polymerase sigma subunit (sigma70/sigma32)
MQTNDNNTPIGLVALVELELPTQRRKATYHRALTKDEVDATLSVTRLNRLDSIDRAIESQDDITLGDLVATSNDIIDNVIARVDESLLVEGLTERERYIINRRLGINGSATSTLDAVGEALGITRERVRQIQEDILRDFRRRRKALGLASYSTPHHSTVGDWKHGCRHYKACIPH